MGKAGENRTKEGPGTGVRTLGRTNNHSWLAQFTYSRLRGRRKNIQKEEPKGWGSLSSLRVFWVGITSCLDDVFSFIF